jgi:DUF3043 family protein
MAKTPSPQPVGDSDVTAAPTKGQPTPKRKEQEAARKRPLVPTDRRLAAKQSRSQVQAQRERARIGMAAGEEKYLPARDKGPQKRYVRDYIDARWSLGEVLLPLLVLTILSYFFEAIAPYVLIAVWAVIAVLIVEAIVVGGILRRKLAAKFGAGKVERGVSWYAAMRMIQMRVLRLPKPQVKRGQFPS